jgi:isochorismate synthase/2-succinyl-5-enolpyruvyl-6-hydroxy-3-cyclohexene-1-carboxylate synthase/2-succinyl-6-hydroxy-2,4-cyclohexadiene-1-carboxylate synthase/O-succinylbenzoate synthase
MLLAGAEDAKFVAGARAMAKETETAANAAFADTSFASAPPPPPPEVVVVPGAGHAVHLEAPEALVLPLLRFVRGIV